MKNKALQTGITLVEVMVSLLIGAFLLGGVLQTFVGSKQTNRLLEELSRIQENGRYAIDLLANDIRMAGFLGCNRLVTINNVINMPPAPGDFLYNFAGRAIEGFEASSPTAWTPAMNPAIDPDGGSDVITIRRADNTYGFPVISHPTSASDIVLDASASVANLKSADILKDDGTTNNCAMVVASSCSAAAVFLVSAVAGNTLSHATGGCGVGNSTADFLGRTFEGGMVYPINTISYFVKTSVQGQPTLYRKVGLKSAEPLVEGIEQMQILYGVDKYNPGNDPALGIPCNPADTMGTFCGTADYYVKADQLTATDKVISVRVSLLAVSVENVTSGGVQYVYDGAMQQSQDNLLRRVFTSTISVRNQ